MLSYIAHVRHYGYWFLQEYTEESNSEPDVDLENQYYGSKGLKEENPEAALKSFEKVRYTYVDVDIYLMLAYQVLELEDTKGEWGFKALKQMIKLHFKLVRR